MITIQQIDPIEAKNLIDELDAFQLQFYTPESCHMDCIATLQQDNVFFYGAIEEQEIIAIGAVKLFQEYGELKRIYVPPTHRRRGLAKRIINILEKTLLSKELSIARLETGIHSHEAIKLYQDLGYSRCEKFGSYKGNPLSVFMEKRL